MSLINQMLKDLEQRNASADGIKPLSGDVRTVRPAQGGTNWLRLILIIVMVSALAGVAWWKYPVLAMKPMVPSPAPVAAKSQAPSSTPAAPVPVPAQAQPVETPVAPRLPGLEMELNTTPLAAVPAEKKSKPLTDSASGMASIPGDIPKLQADAKIKEKAAIKALQSLPGSSLKSVTPQQKSDNLYRQAVTMLQQGRVSEARVALTQCLEDSPLNHNSRQLLVGLLVEGKHNDEALSLLQEGVRLAPDQSGFVMALARLQVEKGDRKAALQIMEQGVKYAANDADYQGFYAALLQHDERHEEAVPHYLSALQSDPANTSWLIGIGISLQELKRFADAREAFERAKQLGQLSPELADFVDQRLRQLQGK